MLEYEQSCAGAGAIRAYAPIGSEVAGERDEMAAAARAVRARVGGVAIARTIGLEVRGQLPADGPEMFVQWAHDRMGRGAKRLPQIRCGGNHAGVARGGGVPARRGCIILNHEEHEEHEEHEGHEQHEGHEGEARNEGFSFGLLSRSPGRKIHTLGSQGWLCRNVAWALAQGFEPKLESLSAPAFAHSDRLIRVILG